VLLIDLDPRGNATTGSGFDKSQLKNTVYHVLIGDQPISKAIQRAEDASFDVLPSNRDLAGAEVELVNEIGRETKLKVALAEVANQYDYVFLDCPPALNLVTVNALTAANAVMIPMQCEYFALEGLADLSQTIERLKSLNPNLHIRGVLRTMFDPRNTLALQVSAQLEQHFADKVFNTLIPRNVRLAEAPSFGVPAVIWDPTSRGAQAYVALAKELRARFSTQAE